MRLWQKLLSSRQQFSLWGVGPRVASGLLFCTSAFLFHFRRLFIRGFSFGVLNNLLTVTIMAEGEATNEDWDSMCQEWLPNTGYCSAGGVCSAEDGVIYAAASKQDKGWAVLYKEDHEQDQIGEDGNPCGKVTINEGSTIKSAVEEGVAPNGVWIGGVKYKVVRPEKDVEYNGVHYDTVMCARPKGGAHLIKTPQGTVVVATYDEEKEQSAGNSRTCALAFAQHLNELGY